MPYFALIYDVVPDMAERRGPYRPEHLRLARASQERGELVMAGALGEPPGALLVFRGADRSVAEAFATHDPYVIGGLVTKWTVRPWVVVVGQDSDETPPGLPS